MCFVTKSKVIIFFVQLVDGYTLISGTQKLAREAEIGIMTSLSFSSQYKKIFLFMRTFLLQKCLTETTNNFWKLPIGVKSLTEILLASTLKGQLCHDNKCNVATSNQNAPSLSLKGVLKIPDILPRSSPVAKIMVQDLGKTS